MIIIYPAIANNVSFKSSIICSQLMIMLTENFHLKDLEKIIKKKVITL